MLRFFRTLRQSLINASGFRKYLLYAIGEVVLVMIGILLALQVNNWNEERRQKDVLLTFLSNLKENLQDDIDLLTTDHESSQFRYYAIQYLLRISGNSVYNPLKEEHIVYDWIPNWIWNDSIPDQYNKEFIQLAFLWTHRFRSTKPNTSTIEELKSTGMYSVLAEELKESLNKYYDQFEFRYGVFAYERTMKAVLDWQDSLGKEGVTNADPFRDLEDPIQLLIGQPERIYLMNILASASSWRAMSSKILIERASDVIKLINRYLEK